jgi:hypothetical protein
MFMRSLTRPSIVLGIVLVVAGCSGTATPPPQAPGGSTTPAPGGSTTPAAATVAPSAPSVGAGGSNSFEGSLVSSGVYAATWTAAPNAEIDPFNASGNLTMTSDKGAFGNLKVNPDRTLAFGSAAKEFDKDTTFEGTAANVTLDPTGQFVCAFTVDADLKGTRSGTILHLAGGLTVHWHPESAGGLNCP